MNRDKIGTQTYYIHQCTKRYVDVNSMSVSQSCLCSFYITPVKTSMANDIPKARHHVRIYALAVGIYALAEMCSGPGLAASRYNALGNNILVMPNFLGVTFRNIVCHVTFAVCK